MSDHLIDEWKGCYPSAWKGKIVPEAITHPAKFSSKLIRRIYDHMVAEGWLKASDMVIDPFGGVALGALDAMRLGIRWRGIELEPRFADLGNQNIKKWNGLFRTMPGWCTDAVLLQGDSRHLLEILNGGDGVVTSPPFIDQFASHDHFVAPKDTTRLMDMGKNAYAGMVSSPPYSEARIGQESGQEHAGRGDQYGPTPGQLGAMRAEGFDAALASPPFRQATGGSPEPKPGGAIDAALYARHSAGNSAAEGYGGTEGQLANMPEGDFDATVASPPYEAIEVATTNKSQSSIDNRKKMRADGTWEGYNRENADNLGNNAGEDFWTAARQIVDQVFIALRPGGHAVWVVKGFVKNKELVDFPGQWRQLCEAAGFRTLHEHHAMLVHDKGTSHTLEGGTVHHKTESKSFFRRLAESKGSPRIDYETVLCMIKPDVLTPQLFVAAVEEMLA